MRGSSRTEDWRARMKGIVVVISRFNKSLESFFAEMNSDLLR